MATLGDSFCIPYGHFVQSLMKTIKSTFGIESTQICLEYLSVRRRQQKIVKAVTMGDKMLQVDHGKEEGAAQSDGTWAMNANLHVTPPDEDHSSRQMKVRSVPQLRGGR
jgi:hypothetical protein